MEFGDGVLCPFVSRFDTPAEISIIRMPSQCLAGLFAPSLFRLSRAVVECAIVERRNCFEGGLAQRFGVQLDHRIDFDLVMAILRAPAVCPSLCMFKGRAGQIQRPDLIDGQRYPVKLDVQARILEIAEGLYFARNADGHLMAGGIEIGEVEDDRGSAVFRAIYEDNDPSKRIMALANFNTDISEYWEWSDTGFKPIDESNEAYKIGVNYIMYGFTH